MKISELFENNYNPVPIKSPVDDFESSCQHLVDLLNKDYSKMVTSFRESKTVLLRGISQIGFDPRKKAKGPIAWTMKIRKDRAPVEMPAKLHAILSDIFEQLELDATRSNSIFCTTQTHIARTWGRGAVVFVKDGWSGTVFEKFKEDYTFGELQNIADDTKTSLRKLPYVDAIKQGCDKVKKLGPLAFDSVNKLNMVLTDEYHDILITGEDYIALPLGNPTTTRVLELLDIKAGNLE